MVRIEIEWVTAGQDRIGCGKFFFGKRHGKCQMQNTSTPHLINSSLECTVESVLYVRSVPSTGGGGGTRTELTLANARPKGRRELGGGVEGVNVLHFYSMFI